MEVITDVVEKGPEWMIHKAANEDFSHHSKSAEDMAALAPISGLARILFTSVAKLTWFNTVYKAFLFALAHPEDPREFPHLAEVAIPSGIQLSVFHHVLAPGA